MAPGRIRALEAQGARLRRRAIAAADIEFPATAGVFLSMLTAFYAGFRMPNLWSINYFIPSYFDGFGRRSLLGTLLYPFGGLRFDYHFIASLQAVVLASLLAAVASYAIKSGVRYKSIVIVFMLAPTGGFLFMEIGYVDQLLFLMLLVALSVEDSRVGLLLMVLALLVHEVAAFTVVPLYLAGFVHKERYRTGFVQGTVLVGVFGVIYLALQTTSDPVVEAFMAKIQANAAYPLRRDYYEVFSNSFTGNRGQNYYLKSNVPHLAMVVAIAASASASLIRLGESRASLMTAGCMFVACVAPLALGWFGWDIERWFFVSVALSGLTLALFARASLIGVSLFTCLLAIWSIGGTMEYFDGAVPRSGLPLSKPYAFFTKELPTLLRTTPLR